MVVLSTAGRRKSVSTRPAARQAVEKRFSEQHDRRRDSYDRQKKQRLVGPRCAEGRIVRYIYRSALPIFFDCQAYLIPEDWQID
jgi:hypothetical protein